MDYAQEALKKHKEWQGKIRVTTPCVLENRDDLSVAYTPGVAAPCLEIQKDVEKSYEYTRRGNLVAVVTGYHNSEYIGFLLLYLIICYQGMLLGVALAAAAAWVLRKISGRKRP